jgi:hypothetical protein
MDVQEGFFTVSISNLLIIKNRTVTNQKINEEIKNRMQERLLTIKEDFASTGK